jgi:hypothetical protein
MQFCFREAGFSGDGRSPDIHNGLDAVLLKRSQEGRQGEPFVAYGVEPHCFANLYQKLVDFRFMPRESQEKRKGIKSVVLFGSFAISEVTAKSDSDSGTRVCGGVGWTICLKRASF